MLVRPELVLHKSCSTLFWLAGRVVTVTMLLGVFHRVTRMVSCVGQSRPSQPSCGLPLALRHHCYWPQSRLLGRSRAPTPLASRRHILGPKLWGELLVPILWFFHFSWALAYRNATVAVVGCPPPWRELLTTSPFIASPPTSLCLRLGEHRLLRGGGEGLG